MEAAAHDTILRELERETRGERPEDLRTYLKALAETRQTLVTRGALAQVQGDVSTRVQDVMAGKVADADMEGQPPMGQEEVVRALAMEGGGQKYDNPLQLAAALRGKYGEVLRKLQEEEGVSPAAAVQPTGRATPEPTPAGALAA